MAKTIKVLATQWDRFLSNLKRLNERAAEKGLAEITYTKVGEGDTFVISAHTRQSARVAFVEVSVSSAPVVTPSWTLLACRTEVKGVSRIQHFAPGTEVPLYLLDGDLTCHHCNTVRHRKRTFFVLNRDNRISQVGHACLKEYTGVSLASVTAGARLLDALDKLLESSALVEVSEAQLREGGLMWSTAVVVAHSLAVLKEHQWVSRATAERRDIPATTDRVTAKVAENPELSAELQQEATAVLQKMREYFEDNPPTEAFDASMGSVLYGEEVLRTEVGLVAWATFKFGTVKPAPVESQFVGKPKARLDLDVTIDRVVELGMSNYGGFSELVIMRDDKGNRLLWKTTARPNDIKEGSSHRIRATVTGHDFYKADRQTTLNRVTFAQSAGA